MPTGLLTVSQYTTNPPQQVSAGSLLEVRGWYNRDFIAGDGVTPVYGSLSNGQQGPYYSITPTLNGSGDLVVPAHEIQATTLSNPTASYFEGLWVDGAFSMFLMPNTQGASGWAIPTIYGDPIAFDEIATYNRAKRLLYPPDTYFTADQVIAEILRLSGNFDYMAVGINGIGSASVAPLVASQPIVLMENDQRVMDSIVDVTKAPFYATGDGVTDDTAAIQAALDLFAYNGPRQGGRIWVPNGIYCVTGLTYRGDYGHSFVMEGPNGGEAGTADMATLKYTGSAGGTLFQMLGANWCTIERIQFNGNGLALRDLTIDYDTSRSQGSFDCHVDHCDFGGAVGVNSTCLVLGTSNFASAEHLVTNSRFIYSGLPGTTYFGVKSFGTANCKNYTIRDCDFIGFRWAVVVSNSGYHRIEGCSFAGQTFGDVIPGAHTVVTSFASEGSKKLIYGDGISSTVAGTLTLSNGYFAGAGDASQYVVVYAGKLTVMNTDWISGPAAGDNPPKFKTGFGSDGAGIVSINNLYNWNAVTAADFIPFYDSSDRLIGTLAIGSDSANADLFSSGDGGRDASSNPVVTFPTWSVKGNIGVYPKVVDVTAYGGGSNYGIAYGDSEVLAQGVAGPFGTGYSVVSLTTPALGKGKRHRVFKTDAGIVPVVLSNGFTANINGVDRIILVNQYDWVEVESDGTLWRITSKGSAAGSFTSLTATSITDSGLTAGRIPFAGVGGLLGDDGDLTFATDTLTGTKLAATTSMTVSASGKLRLTPKTGQAYSNAMTIDVTISNQVMAVSFTTSPTSTWTPSAAGSAGDILILTTEADASGTVTTTFAATFHSSGTQATTASRFSTITFISDGTRWVEVSRVTALV